MKTCFKCGETKPLWSFYVHPAMADGHLNKCKVCCKNEEKIRRRTPKFRERMRAYDKARFQMPERKAQALEAQRQRQKNHPEKNRAHCALRRAVENHPLLFPRQACEICGAPAQAHHEDYSKPLAVRWLCFKHHREIEHNQIVGPIRT